MNRKLIIVAAPSGAGKTSIVRHLLQEIPQLSFSISATTRAQRPNEVDGKDYYFISTERFQELREKEGFLEWEEVYKNQFYGTLKSEVDRLCKEGKVVIFDVDVIGAMNIKRFYQEEALSVFIKPPTIACLRDRLQCRGTETAETLQKRLDKAEYELTFENQFDTVIVNEDLDEARSKAKQVILDFLCKE